MGLSSKVGSFNLSSASNGATTAVSGLGLSGESLKVLFLWSEQSTTTTDTVVDGSIQYTMGFGTSTTSRRGVGYYSEDAAMTSDSGGVLRDDAILQFLTVAAANNGLIDISSFDSDGFTLVNDSAVGGTYRIHYLAIWGSDITNATVVTASESGSTGNQDNTAIGFQPDCAVFIGCNTLALNTIENDCTPQIGFAAGSTPANACVALRAADGSAAANTDRYSENTNCLTRITSLGVTARAAVTAWLSNGFTLNWAEAGSSTTDYAVLCIKGGAWKVGDLLTQTDTTTDIVESGFGFQPAGALFASHCTSESTIDTTQTEGAFSLGAFSGTSARAAVGFLDEDGVDPMQTNYAIEHDAVYVRLFNTAVVAGLMDIKSVDSDGFTCIMDDADPDQAFVPYLAFGPSVSAGSTAIRDCIGRGIVPFRR